MITEHNKALAQMRYLTCTAFERVSRAAKQNQEHYRSRIYSYTLITTNIAYPELAPSQSDSNSDLSFFYPCFSE
jgi:hypothetical protein